MVVVLITKDKQRFRLNVDMSRLKDIDPQTLPAVEGDIIRYALHDLGDEIGLLVEKSKVSLNGINRVEFC